MAMDTLDISLKLGLALALGAVIGFEREINEKRLGETNEKRLGVMKNNFKRESM